MAHFHFSPEAGRARTLARQEVTSTLAEVPFARGAREKDRKAVAAMGGRSFLLAS